MPQPGNLLEPSLTELSFLKSSLLHSIRPDGRDFLEARPITLKFSSELGWVEVTLGRTRVLVSTHASLVSPRSDRPYEGFIEIRSEIQPIAGNQFERGRSNEEEVIFDRGIEKAIRRSDVVDREALCIVAGYKVWSICLTVHLLSAQGCALDAAILGCITALRQYRRPDISIESGSSVSVSRNKMQYISHSNRPRIIIYDESERVPVPLALQHHPLAVSFAIFDPIHLESSFVSGIGAGSASNVNYAKINTSKDDVKMDRDQQNEDQGIIILVDPSPLETTLCTSKLTVVANAQGEVCVLDKAGGGPLSQVVIQRAIQIARNRVKDMTEIMETALQKDSSTRVIDVL